MNNDNLHRKSPKVSVIILNWNGKDDTLECLGSFKKIGYTNYEIIVVDNGSSDGSEEVIKSQYPDIVLLQAGENLGYAGGNNVGISWALKHGTDYLLILNNDTVVAPDLLNAFVDAAILLPQGSILGAKIYFYDKPDTLWCAGGRWLSDHSRFEHVGGGKIDSEDFNSVVEVDYITGCALFADAETFKDIGLLDEQLFLTYEETDWCYRARAKSHKCLVVPTAKLWHKVSSSFGGATSPIVTYFMVRNKLLWGEKHLSLISRIKLHIEAICVIWSIYVPPITFGNEGNPFLKGLFWSFLSWTNTIKRNLSDPTNKAIMFGYRDYYFRRFGNCPAEVRNLAR